MVHGLTSVTQTQRRYNSDESKKNIGQSHTIERTEHTKVHFKESSDKLYFEARSQMCGARDRARKASTSAQVRRFRVAANLIRIPSNGDVYILEEILEFYWQHRGIWTPTEEQIGRLISLCHTHLEDITPMIFVCITRLHGRTHRNPKTFIQRCLSSAIIGKTNMDQLMSILSLLKGQHLIDLPIELRSCLEKRFLLLETHENIGALHRVALRFFLSLNIDVRILFQRHSVFYTRLLLHSCQYHNQKKNTLQSTKSLDRDATALDGNVLSETNLSKQDSAGSTSDYHDVLHVGYLKKVVQYLPYLESKEKIKLLRYELALAISRLPSQDQYSKRSSAFEEYFSYLQNELPLSGLLQVFLNFFREDKAQNTYGFEIWSGIFYRLQCLVFAYAAWRFIHAAISRCMLPNLSEEHIFSLATSAWCKISEQRYTLCEGFLGKYGSYIQPEYFLAHPCFHEFMDVIVIEFYCLKDGTHSDFKARDLTQLAFIPCESFDTSSYVEGATFDHSYHALNQEIESSLYSIIRAMNTQIVQENSNINAFALAFLGNCEFNGEATKILKHTLWEHWIEQNWYNVVPQRAILLLQCAVATNEWEQLAVRQLIGFLNEAGVKMLADSDLAFMCSILTLVPIKDRNLLRFIFAVVRRWHSAVQTREGAQLVSQYLPSVLFLVCRTINTDQHEALKELANVALGYNGGNPECTARSIVAMHYHIFLGKESWLDNNLVASFLRKALARNLYLPNAVQHRTFFHAVLVSSPFSRKTNLLYHLLQLCSITKLKTRTVDTLLCHSESRNPTHTKIVALCVLLSRGIWNESSNSLLSDIHQRFASSYDLLFLASALSRVPLQGENRDKCISWVESRIPRCHASELRLLVSRFLTKYPRITRMLIREISKRLKIRSIQRCDVLSMLQACVTMVEENFDKEFLICIDYLLKSPSCDTESAFMDLVSILQMMGHGGWKHDGLLRKSVSRFLAIDHGKMVPYHISSLLATLRRIEVADVYTPREFQRILFHLCGKINCIHQCTPISGRLAVSIMTSLSTLNYRDSSLLASFEKSFLRDLPTMDCITVSALLLTSSRLGYHKHEFLKSCFGRCEELNWTRFPTQAIHVVYAAFDMGYFCDVLVFIMNSIEISRAMRSVLEQHSIYRLLSDAVSIAQKRGMEHLLDTPVAQLVTWEGFK